MQLSLFRPDQLHENIEHIIPLFTDLYEGGLEHDIFKEKVEFAGLSLVWFSKNYPVLFSEKDILRLKMLYHEFDDAGHVGYKQYRIIHACCALWNLFWYKSDCIHFSRNPYLGWDLFLQALGHGNSSTRMMALECMFFVAGGMHVNDPDYVAILEESIRRNVLGAPIMLYMAHQMKGSKEDLLRIADRLLIVDEIGFSQLVIEKFKQDLDMPLRLIANPLNGTLVNLHEYIIHTLFFDVW